MDTYSEEFYTVHINISHSINKADGPYDKILIVQNYK